jgi:TRAP-type C4-dicarboxylate transport system permease small subunit
MVITVQLGMGEALAIVWLLGVLLGVRREHALRVGLLVMLLGPLVVRILLTRNI